MRGSVRRAEEGAPAPAAGDPSGDGMPPRELLAAWVEFLKDDLARAVNALNNRLNAIAGITDDLMSPAYPPEQNTAAERIRTEVRRAAKITRGLLRRVTAIAPDSVPATYEGLDVSAEVRPARLLVVEDDTSNRTVITKLFKKLGHQVTAVSNGFEAFELLQHQEVDCVICDLRMASLSGRTLFEQVEELLPHLARRFVFVTGDYTRPSSREFLEQSGCPVVAKPYAAEQLLAAVSGVLRRSRALVKDL